MKPTFVSASSARRLAAAIGVACSAGASAQSSPTANAPAPGVGDVWKYRVVDLWTGREQSSYSSEFVGTEGDRLVFRVRSSDAAEVRTHRFTKDLGPCRSMKNSDVPVCAGALRFPMSVGDRHAFAQAPWTNGEGHDTEECGVKAFEKVTVPAGSYDAYRVECEGNWTRVFEGNFSGRVQETHWYAPAVERSVKWTYTNYRSSGGVYTKRQTELVEYTPKR